MIIFFFSLTLLHTETLQPAKSVLRMLIWTLTKVIFYVLFYTLISIVLLLFQRQGDGGILGGIVSPKNEETF